MAPPPRALDPRGSEIAGILQQLETMSPDQLSNLLTDADAFKQFMTRHLADTPVRAPFTSRTHASVLWLLFLYSAQAAALTGTR